MNKEGFLKDVTNWNNHRILLWKALENTSGKVVEFGSGDGSTAYLREYCKNNNREFLTFDNNQEWCEKTGSKFVANWDEINLTDVDVLLIDHAPGERRWVDIERYSKIAKVIVIHDAEPAATGYMLDRIWYLFPYRINTETTGAWATLVSNFFSEEAWK